jgi:hypothetical protein
MPEEMGLEEEIVKLLEREPFHPFSISLTSGEKHVVDDPHSVALGGNLIAIIKLKSGLVFFRKSQVVGVDAPEPAA